jgi:hypothetical protein
MTQNITPSSKKNLRFGLWRTGMGSMMLYFMVSTIGIYGMWRWTSTIRAIVRDGLFVVFGLLAWIILIRELNRYKTQQLSTIRRLKVWFGLLIMLISWSLAHARRHWITLQALVIGFKYTLWMRIILWGSILIWFVTALKSPTTFYETKRHQWFMAVSILILLIGFMIQWAKYLWPEVFIQRWFGPVGDYVFGSSPPIWYRTGPGGIDRRSGLFAGPNTYGYILVWRASMLVYSGYMLWQRPPIKKHYLGVLLGIVTILYIAALILTYSRWALLWVAVQITVWLLIIARYLKNTYVMTLLGLIPIALVVWIVWLSQGKMSSTIEHLKQFQESITVMQQQPRWRWLGTAWPSIHIGWLFLPENMFAQVWIDIGWIWLILRCCVASTPLARSITQKNNNKSGIYWLVVARAIGYGALHVEGFFLHVWEDSMMNYLFLGIGWWILGQYFFSLYSAEKTDAITTDKKTR